MQYIVVAIFTAIVVGVAPKPTVVDEPSPPIVQASPEVVEEKPVKPKKAKHIKKLDPVKDNPNNCNLKKQYVWEDFTCHDKVRASEPVKTQVAPVARSGGTSGVEQWRSLVSRYDWPVETVLRIMRCESGGNPNAVGDTTTAYSSYGLMQIRALPGRPSPNWLLTPENNIQYAYQLYKGQGFHPWSCY